MICCRVAAITLLLLQLIIACLAFHVNYPNYLQNTVAKRSNMDLAFMQMYDLCDTDTNGIFTPDEYPCLDDALRIFFGRK
ncbi:hypothetical protein SNE40_017611 [Patella caerulea]|uniref:EF-hand domain-containing protein n=1 Tax=Patella caerulea TaxID=87958 RepID=A0AAN8JFB1_PATCE